MSRLDSGLQALSLPPASRKMRAVLRFRTRQRKRVAVTGVAAVFLAVTWFDAVVTNAIEGDARWVYSDLSESAAERWREIWGEGFESVNQTLLSPLLRAALISVIWSAVQVVPIVVAYRTAAGQRWSVSKKMRIWRRFAILACIAQAVAACADVAKAGPVGNPDALRRLSVRMARLEAEVLSLHRSTGALPLKSHRRRRLKNHYRLVVAQMRRAEARVDVEGVAALAPLASLMMKLGERFLVGRTGALLDAEDFDTGVAPVRDWESLRLISAALLIASCAVGVGLLSLPDHVTVYVIGACGVVILSLLYGRRVYDFLGLLSLMRGQ